MPNHQSRIPFVPLPQQAAEKISHIFSGFGSRLSKAFPSMKLDLYIAEIPFHTEEYLSLAIFSGLLYFFLIFGFVFLISAVAATADIFLSLGISILFSFFVFSQILIYPKFLVSRKTRDIESNLLPALYHMMIEVKSGVPLFNALVGVSEGYGKVSEEFKKIVSRINAGVSETEALDSASEKNPSLYFRRAIMQIVNSIKAGGTISNALEAIVDNLTKEQVISVKKYSQELNPLTMMYMLVAVILPTLGLTFLIVLSSFSGGGVPKIIFPTILFALAAFQFFFMGIVKTKRPATGV